MEIFQAPAWVIAVPILALLALYIGISSYLSYRRCPQIKGPWLASVSDLWLFQTTFAGRMYLDCAAELDKYGESVPPSARPPYPKASIKDPWYA